ncbi:hypothetical protein Tco_1106427 [Tanacetum coccineum]
MRFLANINVLLLHLIERRDEKKRLDHLKQDLRMLVIKRFRERKKIFRERKLSKKFVQRVDCMMVVKEIEDELLDEMEVSLFWEEVDDFGVDQDIGGESEDDSDKRLVIVSEEGYC